MTKNESAHNHYVIIHAVFIVLHISAHILFDDAMELNDDEEWVPNQFVKLMMSIIDEAARYCIVEISNSTRTFLLYPLRFISMLLWNGYRNTVLKHLSNTDQRAICVLKRQKHGF